MKMLTNKEVLQLEKSANAKSKKGKIVFIKKDLSVEESIKKPFCKIIVSYLVENRMPSSELAKKIKVSKNNLESATLYQYEKVSFTFLIDTVNKLASVDASSKKRLDTFVNSLK